MANRKNVKKLLIDYLNGDGLLDQIVRSAMSIGAYYWEQPLMEARFNTGSSLAWLGPWWNPKNRGGHYLSYPIAANQHGQYGTLMDMNGDGLPDRVEHHNYDIGKYGIWVALNTGGGFGAFQLWWDTRNEGGHYLSYPIGSNQYGKYSVLMDMNGDGLPDRVGHYNYDPDNKTKKYGIWVALNNGAGFGRLQLWWDTRSEGGHYLSYPIGSNGNGQYSTFIDMNGDGLPDRVGHYNYKPNLDNDKKKHGIWVALNRGYVSSESAGDGFDKFELWWDTRSEGGHYLSYPVGSNGNGQYSALIDMNGDGLPDRVEHYNYDPKVRKYGIWVALNNGSKFGKLQLWWNTRSEGGHYLSYPVGSNGNGKYSVLTDMNGDGLPDRVEHYNYDPDNKTKKRGIWVALNRGYVSSESAEDGFGKLQLWWDQPANGGHYLSYPVGSNNGSQYSVLVDMNGDGLPDRAGHSSYRGNKPWSRIYGFMTALNKSTPAVITGIVSSSGHKINIRYDQFHNPIVRYKNEYHASDKWKRDWRAARTVVKQTKISNGVGGFNNTTYQYHGSKIDARGRGLSGFRRIDRTDVESGKTTSTEFYQDFPLTGQVKQVKESLGGLTLNQADFAYQTRDGANSKIKRVSLSKKTEISRSPDSSMVTQTDTFHRNIDAFGNIGEVEIRTTGAGQSFSKITTNSYDNFEDKWILGRLKTAQVVHKHIDGSELIRKSSFDYYSDNGLLRLEVIEPGSRLALKTEYFYDSFGAKVRIEKTGLAEEGRVETRVSQVAYDNQGINVVSRTNALGHTETYDEYDSYDNLRKMTGPNGLSTSWEYDPAGRKVKEIRADGTTTTWSRSWDNSLAFAVHSLTSATSGASPKTEIYDSLGRVLRTIGVGFDGQTVYRDIQYDRFSKVYRQSPPYFAGSDPQWIVFVYDSLGRETEKQSPGSNDNTLTTKTGYAGLTTTYTDAKGRVKTVLKNIAGKVVKVTDAAGGIIRYEYDALGKLTKTTDAGGNVTDLFYDNRGNKESMNAPNMGIWEYEHNAFGELIWQKDAKGQILKIKYDILGRKIERTEEEGTTFWIYDKAARGIGKIYEVRSGGYLKRYGYDRLGRSSSTVVSVDQQTHSVLTAYDESGRIDFQAWPGDFRLYRRYNSHGYLSALQSPKKESVDGFNKTQLEDRMNQALQAATDAQRMAFENRVEKLRYEKKAETYRKIAALLKNHGVLIDDLRQASETLSEYGGELGKEAGTNEAQAGEYYKQAEEISGLLAQTGGSEANIHQNYIYHQQMSDMLAEMAEVVLTSEDESFLTKDSAELAVHCMDQAQYHQKQAVHYQNKAGDADLNGLDQIQMMVDDGDRWITYWRAGSYDPAGRLVSEVNGNGLYTEKSYNPAGEIDQILSRFGYEDPIRNLSYRYDKNSNVVARYDRIQNAGEEFEYDALDRLTEVRGGDNLSGSVPAEAQAEEEESQGDVKRLSFSGRWSSSGGRASNSSANPSFSFSLNAKSLVTIDLTSKTRYWRWWRWTDTYLYLKDSSGRVIAADDDGGYWLFSKISVVLEAGDYEIVAATYSRGQWGSFNLSLDSVKPPAVKNGKWERSGGRQAYHSGNPVIPIVVTEKTPLQIDLMSRQDTYLYLLNAEKREIRRNDDGGAGYNSRLRLTLDKGQYYLVAATYRPGKRGDFQVLLSDAARFGTLRKERVVLAETTSTQSFRHDNRGNMTYNSSVGDYQYDPSRPHAVKQAGSNVYEYDANGNVTHRNKDRILWSSFNKPAHFVKESGTQTHFRYAPDRSRYLKLRHTVEGNLISRTFYMGKDYERISLPNGSIIHKYFIYADGKLTAIHSKTEAAPLIGASPALANAPVATEQIRYLHYDSLGSVDTVTNGQGAIVERMSYTAFGKRRASASGSGAASAPVLTNRGFTGHEHIDEMDLIHMNGRVYDPLIGRFLSADPHIQAPYNSQSYNRYSYVLNNPLKYTDPSGYFWNKVKKWVKKNWKSVAIAAVVITVACLTGGAALGLTGVWSAMASGALAGAAGGLIGGYMATGTWQGALRGAVIGGLVGGATAGLFHGATSMAGSNIGLKALYHGTAGGLKNVAMGRNFGQGFMAAAVTAGASPYVSAIDSATYRVAMAAAIGGTAAQLGGGKFANGAVTGAYSRMFNDQMHGIKLKKGVNAKNLHPKMKKNLEDIEFVYSDSEVENPVMTSANDGTHGTGSLHYQNKAIDMRSNFLSDVDQDDLAHELQTVLGDDFTVISEHFKSNPNNDHIHIELDKTNNPDEAIIKFYK